MKGVESVPTLPRNEGTPNELRCNSVDQIEDPLML